MCSASRAAAAGVKSGDAGAGCPGPFALTRGVTVATCAGWLPAGFAETSDIAANETPSHVLRGRGARTLVPRERAKSAGNGFYTSRLESKCFATRAIRAKPCHPATQCCVGFIDRLVSNGCRKRRAVILSNRAWLMPFDTHAV